MDVSVQDLIDKIKNDGIGAADKNAKQIIADAEKKAAQIVAAAEAKAADFERNAKAEAERFEKASEQAIAQAGRNLLISFRDGVEKQLSALISSEVAKAYDAKLLETLIPQVVKAWTTKGDAETVDVLLSDADCKALQGAFQGALKEQIAKGCEIKSDAALSAGFKIAEKDGSAFYDFSADAVADLFASYLNPRVAKILKEAAK